MKIRSNNIIIILLLAFLYYFAAELNSQIITYTGIVRTIVFPSEGIALAFAIHFGRRVWPGVFIGQFFIAYSNGLDITTSIFISAINSLEAIIAASLFRDLKLDERLTSFRDIIGLSILIVFILQPFSAVTANISLLYFNHIQSTEFLNSTFSWWFGNIMGQFLFTPLILIFFHMYKKINIQEFLIYNLIFISYISLLIYVLHVTSSLLLLSSTLPVLLYIVYKKNAFYALFMIILMTYLISLFMLTGTGPFIYQDGSIHVVDYNLYFLTLLITTLTAKIIFDNQKRQEEKLQQMVAVAVEENRQQQFFMLQQNRLAQMGEMIAMIAHQWKQPLNNLSLLNQLITSKYKKGKLDDKTMEYFQSNAKQYIELMSETIHDFTNFFKPQQDKENFEINELISNVSNIIAPSLHQKSIKFIFSPQNKYSCLGYKNSLAHAIINIINNAKDALDDTQITQKQIKIELYEQDNHLIISIRDNAGGISEDIIDKVFDPYFSTKSNKNGTGLGLYMTKLLITEHMNGEIEVFNSQEGAVFNIILKGEFYEKVT